MKWLAVLMLAAACSRPPQGQNPCVLGQRVATMMAKCKLADQRAVAALLLLIAQPEDGNGDAHRLSCAQQTLALHHVAFAAGCPHALTYEEIGLLEETAGSGSAGSSSATSAAPGSASAGSSSAGSAAAP